MYLLPIHITLNSITIIINTRLATPFSTNTQHTRQRNRINTHPFPTHQPEHFQSLRDSVCLLQPPHHSRKSNLIRLSHVTENLHCIPHNSTLGIHAQQSIPHIHILLKANFRHNPMTFPPLLHIQQPSTRTEDTRQRKMRRHQPLGNHRLVNTHRLFLLTISGQSTNQSVPRHNIPLRHFQKQLLRIAQPPSFTITTQHRIPRVHIRLRHFIKHLVGITQMTTLRVQLNESIR
ncbi:hypothetical protein RchiOBHm_Chr5g0018071 [Rosa chinensis]|uniref:Uncharacterized protein n=1 Tax=Rosa chinensis TaxID=74649 RepID=A0A2P6Q6P0_ROSCH|nr:hypothetical protein RchiOBHm_Chr5g0018071 [Rosa chinensis]